MKAYSWDPSSCITETRAPTGRPTTLAPSAVHDVFQQTGFALPQMSIRLINMPNVEMSNVQSSKVKDVIRLIAEDEVGILNMAIASLDIADVVYSQSRKLTNAIIDHVPHKQYRHRDLAGVLTLVIEISVSDTNVLPDELYPTILGALQLRKYEIDEVFRETFGESYNEVILDIDGQRTTLAPSPASNAVSRSKIKQDAFAAKNSDAGTNRSILTLVLVVVFSLLFALITCGLVHWQRRRDRNSDKAFSTRSYNHNATSPRRKHRHHRRRRRRSSRSKRNLNLSEPTLQIANHATYVDEEQNEMNERLMIGYVPQQQAFSIPQNVQQHEHAADIEEIEMGYDGGQSSFFTSNSNGDFSNGSLNGESTQRQGIDPEESSLGEDNVLGLLYYAGASSAEEEENSQSASRATRMKRRNSLSSSSRHTRTSARSRRSSTSGKSKSSSSKSKSSHSRRRQKLSLNKVDEDHGYDYQREEYFNSQLYQRDEPSISESFQRHQIQTHLPQSGCSVSVSTVSDDEDIMKFNRQRSVGTTITEDKSLDVDDLFT